MVKPLFHYFITFSISNCFPLLSLSNDNNIRNKEDCFDLFFNVLSLNADNLENVKNFD